MRFLFSYLILLPYLSFTQKASVSSEIHTPLGIPLNLSTLFGDICPNHLHMGLDFRTNGIEGIPIYSIREGYIARIKVSRGGYGRVLYINHPNGQTSVYAHCSKFSTQIDSLFISWQIERMQNEIDTTLLPNYIKVEKGELIAFSGNSGSSTGPHLHFEIRETSTEMALNPLEHGFSLVDKTPPFIEAIQLVPLSSEGFVLNNSKINITPAIYNDEREDIVPRVTLTGESFNGAASFGIMIKGGDRMTSSGNKFDIYKSEVFFNDNLVFKCVMDSISFDHTRYVNDYCDYVSYRSSKSKWHKLFYSSGNPLNTYKVNKIKEALELINNEKSMIKIVLSDRNNNSSTYCFWLMPYSFKTTSNAFNENLFYLPKNEFSIKNSNFTISVDPFTLMQPVLKTNVLNPMIPLSKSVRFETILPKKYPTKAYIKIDGKYTKTENKDFKLVSETKMFGSPLVAWDTLPPTINLLSYKDTDSVFTKKIIKWGILDKQTEIGYFALYLNNKFTPVYFDQKSNTISCHLKEENKGPLKIKLLVRDSQDNEAIHEQEFILH